MSQIQPLPQNLNDAYKVSLYWSISSNIRLACIS